MSSHTRWPAGDDDIEAGPNVSGEHAVEFLGNIEETCAGGDVKGDREP